MLQRYTYTNTALGLEDYKDVVKKPMDLNMIRRNNNEWGYKHVEEVFDDIQLCWDNCRRYNKPGSVIQSLYRTYMNAQLSWNRILQIKLLNSIQLLKFLKEFLKEERHFLKTLQHMFEQRIGN